jgi:hypothetical protein
MLGQKNPGIRKDSPSDDVSAATTL